MRRREILVAVGGAAALVAIRPAPAAAGRRRVAADPPNATLYWSAIAEAVIAPGRPPGSAGVLGGIVHAAIHDAAAAASGRYPALLAAGFRQGADVDAAVATAAYLVLAGRVPAQADALSADYAAYRAVLTDSPAVRRGLYTGQQVAEAILALRADDGLDATMPWSQPTPGPGVFEPVTTNPDGTPAAAPVDIKLARVTPLVMATPHRLRPAGPLPLTSDEYAADLAEVAAYGRLDSTVRSAAQTETVRFWAENRTPSPNGAAPSVTSARTVGWTQRRPPGCSVWHTSPPLTR